MSCQSCGEPCTGDQCEQCRQIEANETYHGEQATRPEADDDGVYCWVQDLQEDWHASMYFEGDRHVAACGDVLETPVANLTRDPRRIDETETCPACEAALEADAEEVPDGGFARASSLRADGGTADGDGGRYTVNYGADPDYPLEKMLRDAGIEDGSDVIVDVGYKSISIQDSKIYPGRRGGDDE